MGWERDIECERKRGTESARDIEGQRVQEIERDREFKR